MCRPGRKGRADLTSSPPSSRLAPAVRPESPPQRVGNWTQGLRSLWHLSRHLTARADDNHAAPRKAPRRETARFQAATLPVHAKPHVPPLVRAPVNSFEFHRCRRTPQVEYLTLSLRHPRTNPRTAGIHRLLRGLPGYLILFDPHAFVPQRPCRRGMLPSQSEFCVISMHFTATRRIPHASAGRKPLSFDGCAGLSPDVSPPT